MAKISDMTAASPLDGTEQFEVVQAGNTRRAVPLSQVMMVVEHGSSAATTRPSAGAVYWIGEVEPDNGVDGDLWFEAEGGS
jgi:hypothetical protein